MKNAMYLDYEWFSGGAGLNDDKRNDYIWLLNENGITQQFCDIGVIHDNGMLIPGGTGQLKDWMRISRSIDKTQKIILVLNHGHRKTNHNFGTPNFNKNLNAVIWDLVTTFKPDGIHLDIEGFLPNDTLLLNLLKLIKTDSLPNLHLSISTPATIWSDEYIRQVAEIVDQVNPMIYDTMGWGSQVVDRTTYEAYFRYHIIRYAGALSSTICELVPTLPTYELKRADDGTVYHDPKVESMEAAITALKDSGAKVEGAGIFWGPHYLGLYPKVYNTYPKDQEQWKVNWLGTEL